MDNVFDVGTSNGTIEADAITGKVTKVIVDDGGDKYITEIDRFDLREWHQNYPGEHIIPGSHVDILDLGFWTNTGEYSGPELSWREEFKKLSEPDGKDS